MNAIEDLLTGEPHVEPKPRYGLITLLTTFHLTLYSCTSMEIASIASKEQQDEPWLTLLHQLAQEMNKYETSSKRGQLADKERSSLEILCLMRKLAMIHPEEETRKKYEKDADAWERGDRFDKNKVLRPHYLFLQGCVILVATPILATGAALYGTGKILSGVGDMMTLGRLDKLVTGNNI